MNLVEVEKKEELSSQAKDRCFKQGLYDCVITEVKDNTEYPPADPTWRGLNLTLIGAGDKKTFGRVEYPTEHTEYMAPGKNGALINWFSKFNDFRAFAIALGMKDTEDMGEFVDKMFINKGLVGKTVKVEFAYPRGVHAKYIDANTFELVDEKEVPVEGTRCPNRDACEVIATQKGLKYHAWVRPSKYFVSEQNVVPEKKPVAKKKEAPEAPF